MRPTTLCCQNHFTDPNHGNQAFEREMQTAHCKQDEGIKHSKEKCSSHTAYKMKERTHTCTASFLFVGFLFLPVCVMSSAANPQPTTKFLAPSPQHEFPPTNSCFSLQECFRALSTGRTRTKVGTHCCLRTASLPPTYS